MPTLRQVEAVEQMFVVPWEVEKESDPSTPEAGRGPLQEESPSGNSWRSWRYHLQPGLLTGNQSPNAVSGYPLLFSSRVSTWKSQCPSLSRQPGQILHQTWTPRSNFPPQTLKGQGTFPQPVWRKREANPVPWVPRKPLWEEHTEIQSFVPRRGHLEGVAVSSCPTPDLPPSPTPALRAEGRGGSLVLI